MRTDNSFLSFHVLLESVSPSHEIILEVCTHQSSRAQKRETSEKGGERNWHVRGTLRGLALSTLSDLLLADCYFVSWHAG